MSETPIFDKRNSATFDNNESVYIAPAVIDDEGNYKPTIPDAVRTTAYFAVGIGAPLTGLTVATVAAVAPDATAVVSAIGVAFLSFLGTVAGVFGIAYRPSR